MNTDTVREQIVAGAARAAMCSSLQKMTVGDIAASAGISRATIYRHFAGGRDEIVSALVKSEFQRFLSHVAREAEQADSLEEMLVRGLMTARALGFFAVFRYSIAASTFGSIEPAGNCLSTMCL